VSAQWDGNTHSSAWTSRTSEVRRGVFVHFGPLLAQCPGDTELLRPILHQIR
jgi:hypothetical protein